jgi:hypothetical protein
MTAATATAPETITTPAAAAGAPAPRVLTKAQIAAYHEHGAVLFDGGVSADLLALLRGGCQQAMDETDAQMDAEGTDVLGISRRGNRYFSAQPSLTQPKLFDFIFSPLMEGICRDLMGDNVHVFWEQYVVKGPESGMHFSWHQDSGYVGADTPHKPYLTCWVALDDMSEANGTIYVLPTSRVGIRTRVEHVIDPTIGDHIGYFGADPGDPVLCSAGDIALFSSVTFHRSGWNRTPRLRRTYLIQYSHDPIIRPNGAPYGRTEPFVVNGKRIPR